MQLQLAGMMVQNLGGASRAHQITSATCLQGTCMIDQPCCQLCVLWHLLRSPDADKQALAIWLAYHVYVTGPSIGF